jgi:hypothetical protein
MNPVIVQAVVRHLLTIVGGGLLASWGIDGSTVEAIAGAVATLAGVAWSIYDKRQQANAPQIQND